MGNTDRTRAKPVAKAWEARAYRFDPKRKTLIEFAYESSPRDTDIPITLINLCSEIAVQSRSETYIILIKDGGRKAIKFLADGSIRGAV